MRETIMAHLTYIIQGGVDAMIAGATLSASAAGRIATRLLLCMLLASVPVGLPADVSSGRPGTVSVEALDARIKEVETTAGMADAAKTKLVELYRKARTNLESADADDATTAGYR